MRKKSEERKKEIVKTSLNILHEEGHRNLTVRNIADKIGVSEPAVYKHFDSKEEIIKRSAESVLKENKMLTIDKSYKSGSEFVQGILENLFESLEENPFATAVLFQGDLFSEYPEVQKIFARHEEENKRKIIKAVKKGQEEGFISEKVDSETFTLILMGSIRLVVLEWKNRNFSHSLTDKAPQIAKELVKILKK